MLSQRVVNGICCYFSLIVGGVAVANYKQSLDLTFWLILSIQFLVGWGLGVVIGDWIVDHLRITSQEED